MVRYSFVEFETGADLKTAVEKLDGREYKGALVHCTSDVGYLLLTLHSLADWILDSRRA